MKVCQNDKGDEYAASPTQEIIKCPPQVGV